MSCRFVACDLPSLEEEPDDGFTDPACMFHSMHHHCPDEVHVHPQQYRASCPERGTAELCFIGLCDHPDLGASLVCIVGGPDDVREVALQFYQDGLDGPDAIEAARLVSGRPHAGRP